MIIRKSSSLRFSLALISCRCVLEKEAKTRRGMAKESYVIFNLLKQFVTDLIRQNEKKRGEANNITRTKHNLNIYVSPRFFMNIIIMKKPRPMKFKLNFQNEREMRE